MNYDLALISHVLRTRNLQDAVQAGVTGDILNEEARVYWEFIQAHATRFHEVPSLQLFTDNFPGFQAEDNADGLEALVHNIRGILLARELDGLARKLAEGAFVDPWSTKSLLLELASDIAMKHQDGDDDLIAGDNEHETMELLDTLQATGGLTGMPWPWDLFNRKTPGVNRNHFIYFYGPEKSKKSWLMVFLADFYEDLGYRVQIHSREMDNQEFSLRLYCMRMRIDYEQAITEGGISDLQKRHMRTVMQGFKARRRILFTAIGEGISGIQAKTEQFKPNLIIHDYMKALADDAMAGKNVRAGTEHSFIAAAADRLADYSKVHKVPIMAVGHTNADEGKLQGKSTQDAAGSKHISRRVDYMFRVVNDEFHNRIALILVAGRCAKKFLGLTINGSLCSGFGEVIEENAEWVKDFDVVKGAEEKAKTQVAPPQGTGQVSKISAASFANNTRRA